MSAPMSGKRQRCNPFGSPSNSLPLVAVTSCEQRYVRQIQGYRERTDRCPLAVTVSRTLWGSHAALALTSVCGRLSFLGMLSWFFQSCAFAAVADDEDEEAAGAAALVF